MHLGSCRCLAAWLVFTCLLVPGAHANDLEPLKQLRYDQVRLTGGPFGAQYDALHAHYLSLSNDRLLKVYRQNAGLPAPGADMGGWYDFDGFVPGSTLGQYISGLARVGASTGDPACKEKVRALVTGFAETLGPNNTSIMRPATNLWICYTLDKHFAGLIDAATLNDMPEAIPLLSRVLNGSLSIMPAQGHDRIGVHNLPYDEPFVMPENLFSAGNLTGNPTFDDYAHRYLLNKEFFNILAAGGDPLPGQHAYAHTIALSSGAEAYLMNGNTSYLRALERAFQLITTQQQYASGGWGPDEAFVHPHEGALYHSLTNTTDHFETPCGSVTNAILAVKRPDSDGDYPYYSNYTGRADKEYYVAKWPCCSGTLIQTVGDYPLNLAFTTKSGLHINFYTPSTINFNYGETPITLRQETHFPASDTVAITLDMPHNVACTLALRIPAWVSGHATIALNGKQLATGTPGNWLSLKRTWSSGDTLTLTLPQAFRLESIDDQHPDTVALMRGPVQYVALNAPGNFTRLSAAVGDLRQAAPQVYTDASGLTYVPLYLTGNDVYTSYFSRK